MSAGYWNGHELPSRPDTPASRCLAILEAGLSRMGITPQPLPVPTRLGAQATSRALTPLAPGEKRRHATRQSGARPPTSADLARAGIILSTFARTGSVSAAQRAAGARWSSVLKVLSAAGVEIKAWKRQREQSRDAEVLKHFAEHKNIARAARELRMGTARVLAILNENQVERKRAATPAP